MAAASENLSKYRWENRLLVLVFDLEDHAIIQAAQRFSEQNICGFQDRKLKVISAPIDSELWATLPTPMQSQKGLYLIGLDGGIKDFSKDLSLFDRLDRVIDAMPMRRRELDMQSDLQNC